MSPKANRSSPANIERVWIELRRSVELHENSGDRGAHERAKQELVQFEEQHRGLDVDHLESQFGATRLGTVSQVEVERRWMSLRLEVQKRADAGDTMGKSRAEDALREFELMHSDLNLSDLREHFNISGARR